MSKSTDVQIVATRVHFLPVDFRVPLKFGPETTTRVVCARTFVKVRDRQGREAEGVGETPLSVSWVWPSSLSVATRARRMEDFTLRLAQKLVDFGAQGHPLELGKDFQSQVLMKEAETANHEAGAGEEPMPYLAALVCLSPLDIALHDAYANLLGLDVYQTYSGEHLNRDLSAFLEAEPGTPGFDGLYPSDFLTAQQPKTLPVWHLVGGVDPLTPGDLTGSEPKDGYPVLLEDWIRRDQLECLKIKLRGTDAVWDYQRILTVAELSMPLGLRWLSADFNCTVREPAYVNQILDQLLADHPEIYAKLLYVEQPFAYHLEQDMLDVRSVSARKPLFLDESAHDWEYVRLGRRLGWSGVALKTCKTQTGALLSLCWARRHGMPLMVQDLTNPMLAIVPHARLAAAAATIQGVECNTMQFYPAASLPEEAVHPGLYRRRQGRVDLSTLQGSGFGYRLGEIQRQLPAPAVVCGNG